MDEVSSWLGLAEDAVESGVPVTIVFDLESTIYLTVGLFVTILLAYVLGNIIVKSL